MAQFAPPADNIFGKEMEIVVTDSGCSCDLAGTWFAADRHSEWGLGKGIQGFFQFHREEAFW